MTRLDQLGSSAGGSADQFQLALLEHEDGNQDPVPVLVQVGEDGTVALVGFVEK